MKTRYALLTVLAIFAVAPRHVCAQQSPGISQADLNAAIAEIVNKHTPNRHTLDTKAIIADLEKYAQTKGLSAAQKDEINCRKAWYAASGKHQEDFDQALSALLSITNSADKIRAVERVFRDLTGNQAGANELGIAVKLFPKIKEILTPESRLQMLSTLALQFLLKECNYDEFAGFFEQVAAAQAPAEYSGDDNKIAAFKDRCNTELARMLSALGNFAPDEGLKLWRKHEKRLNDRFNGAVLAACAKGYAQAKNRKDFDATIAQIRKLPVEAMAQPLCDAMLELAPFDKPHAEAALRAEFDAKRTPDGLRIKYLDALLAGNLGGLSPFNYNFHEPGSYEKFKALIKERLLLAEKGLATPFSPNLIETLFAYDDIELAGATVQFALKQRQNDFTLCMLAAKIDAVNSNNVSKAIKMLEAALPIARTTIQSNQVRATIGFLEGKGMAGFNKDFSAGAMDPTTRLDLLRKTSLFLFQARRYGDCQAIFDEITKNMYAPISNKVCAAEYVKNPPASAGSFIGTPFYNDWGKMETRFVPYGDGYGCSAATDAARNLKGVEQPEIDKAFRTGVRALFDEYGVHIFIRCDDPGMADVKTGKRDAGGLEIVFRPGNEDVAYYSISFSKMPFGGNNNFFDWNLPGKNYRLCEDAFIQDASISPDGVVAHLYVPWLNFYNHLPFAGNHWVLGMQRWAPGNPQTISGLVHELSRGLRLEFAFSAEQLLDLKRATAMAAFNRYNKLRNDKGGYIQMWNDRLFGDPEFYAERVAPLLEDLDGAGNKLDAKTPAKEIDALFADKVQFWADIGYEIEARRAKWLNDRLFAK